MTPCFTVEQLAAAGVKMILYPLSAFRAMSKAALNVYETIIEQGTQKPVLDSMQTREQLYAVLGYHAYEQKLDELFARGGQPVQTKRGKRDDLRKKLSKARPKRRS
jgi:methylisocitrate lyase